MILTKDSELGLKGDLIKVQPGYARNWLIPQQLAVYAVRENRLFYGLGDGTQLEEGNAQTARDQEVRKFLQHYSFRLRKVELAFVRPKSEGDHVASPVTAQDILIKLSRENFFGLTAENLIMEPITKIGTYEIEVALHKGWVLPGIGLFAEMEKLPLPRNPKITINLAHKVVLSPEQKLAKAERRAERQKMKKEMGVKTESDEVRKMEEKKERDKLNATGAKVKGKGKK